MKRLAYILDTTLGHLRDFAGAHVNNKGSGADVVPENEIDQIYYYVDHCVSGARGWFKYNRPEWLAKSNPL